MFQQVLTELSADSSSHRRTSIGPMFGSSAACLLSQLAAQRGLLVAITSDSHAANQLQRELNFYCRDPALEVLAFPDWETLPYDNFSPHQDILSERLFTLYRLPQMQRGILVVPVSTLMHRLAPVSYVGGNSLLLDQGQQLPVEAFLHQLQHHGYRRVETVFERGEYALRGSLVDLFPMGSETPYRIDLLDEEVVTLRSFDAESQRTIEQVERIRLLPAREFALHEQAVERFQENWLNQFHADPDLCPLYNEVSAGRVPGGCEYYLPLFFDECASLLDYLPEPCQLLAVGDHHRAAEQFWGEIQHRYQEYGIDPRRPLLPPARGFIPVEELYRELRRRGLLEILPDSAVPAHIDAATEPPPLLTPTSKGESAASMLARFLPRHRAPVLLCAESAGRREVLLESLAEQGLHPPLLDSWQEFLNGEYPLAMVTAPLDRGLYLGGGQPTLITEAQLFGHRVAQRRRRRQQPGQPGADIRDVNELRPGVAVVHIEHGVGRYLGLQTLEAGGQLTEFLALEYADSARLYVPVDSLHLISRYGSSDPEQAPLHKLGSDRWRKARRRASEKVTDMAAELLELYARRATRPGRACTVPDGEYGEFCAGFPFEETPDQREVIRSVLADLCSSQVMDRLVCGDVGFGKTEVALRAAFVAVHNQRQVAVLVPTTLLAQQHAATFSDRFADLPVTVEVLSRMRSGPAQAAIVEGVKSGHVDILIGTHKLLQGRIQYRDLGLLIVDEEHRFGVRQKEAIKALRTEVDILTLTATPIPRTLNMALGELRDLSVIATPPNRRRSIRTFVREHNIALIKEAILRETLRGGQVYYLHNEVRTIEESARKLRELLPDLRIGVAHGQLRERQLEQVMADFYHQQYHILLCSSIIESGIDVPNANTIIIERADRFGLAQLHQLRGRVGRSHHQAYAYLLCPPRSAMSGDAEKRLAAIEAASDLGAGYLLATQDLEIRGAGELLGDEQSGQIHNVGFALYMEMLQRAVESLRRGEIPDLEAATRPVEVNLRIPALIPDHYLPDVNNRLLLYKRIALADEEMLRDLRVEMIDRFGLLPPATRNLFLTTAIKLRAARLGINRVDAGERGGALEFSDRTPIDPLNLVKLVQEQPQVFRLTQGNRLRFQCDLRVVADRLRFVQELLDSVAEDSSKVAVA